MPQFPPPPPDLSAFPPELVNVRRMWEEDELSASFGMQVMEIGVRPSPAGGEPLGYAKVRMTITDRMLNGLEIMHGGFIFTFADSSFALACNASGHASVAMGCDIDYLEQGRVGDVLIADAHERLVRGRSGLTDVTISREHDGVVVAEFRGRSRRLRTTS